MPLRLADNQSDGDVFSIEVPSSQMTFARTDLSGEREHPCMNEHSWHECGHVKGASASGSGTARSSPGRRC